MRIVDRVCQQCSKLFSFRYFKSREGRGKFCSRECRYLSQVGKTPTGTRPAVYVERICQQCGNTFRLSANLLKGQPGIYCSRLCGNRAKANPSDPQIRQRKAKLCSITSKKRWQNPEYLANLSKAQEIAQRKKWQNPEFVAKMIAAFNRKPTKPEQRLISIFSKNLPQFQYNGNFSLGVTLGGLIPDFVNINGKKEVIELFGDYWHSPEVIGDDWRRSELGKVMIYNSLGWRCLVIWGHELNELSEDGLIEKVENFFSKHRRLKGATIFP